MFTVVFRAEAVERLPVIFGEMGVKWIAAVDGTVRVWGARTPDASYWGDDSSDESGRH